ncbi:MAG: alpha/beta fold hydrolase [Dehalococcoidales bacterium]|nr:alpha/beta fold hydrolase [Dehalococcoidales bacterium]
MNTIESKTIKIDGRNVHYYTAGEGEPLVVIHGGAGDARSWWGNIEDLSQKYHVYAPDLPGYGTSQPLDGNYYIPELSDFVNKFTKFLHLKQFNLIGHSMGGGIALNFALKFPSKIKKLILVSSLGLGKEIALWLRFVSIPTVVKALGWLVGSVIQFLGWMLGQSNPFELVMPITPVFVRIGSSIANKHEQSFILEKYLPKIKTPTMLIWGGRDPVVPVKTAYRAVKELPNARLMVFKRSGHNVHREQKKNFSRLVYEFLG